jgi:internalin A
MVLREPWRDEFRSIIDGNDVLSLRLSRSMGWRAHELDFLVDIPNLRGIEIYHSDIGDISALWALKELEHIGLECNFTKAGDFAEFPKLTRCFIRWRQSEKTVLDARALQHLNVIGYPYRNLEPLSALKKLSELKLTSKTLISLEGVAELPALEKLDLYRCTQLSAIDCLGNADTLRSVSFDTCKKTRDIEALRHIHELRVARIDNCGPVASLSPVKGSVNLEELYFVESTNIEDGELELLLQLPRLRIVRFANRRHYSHTRSQIEAALKRRT